MIGDGNPSVEGLSAHCTVLCMVYMYAHMIGNGSLGLVGLSTHGSHGCCGPFYMLNSCMYGLHACTHDQQWQPCYCWPLHTLCSCRYQLEIYGHMQYIYVSMITDGSPGFEGLSTHCTVLVMVYMYAHMIGSGSLGLVGLATHGSVVCM